MAPYERKQRGVLKKKNLRFFTDIATDRIKQLLEPDIVKGMVSNS